MTRPLFAAFVALAILAVHTAHAASIELCGATVAPQYRPIPAGTPEGVAVFLGQWGNGDQKWSTRPALCNALIVESVSANGSATAEYVLGYLKVRQPSAPGVIKVAGRIDPATETFSFELPWETTWGQKFKDAVVYKLVGSQLEGRFTHTGGPTFEVALPRVQ